VGTATDTRDLFLGSLALAATGLVSLLAGYTLYRRNVAEKRAFRAAKQLKTQFLTISNKA
jgi:hypothetical protein